ncbi:hypothetical protein Fmac_006073 [Flemingia macrophylla]|uniref:Uncharacterized protein n=1 Tax=Flemingia macrophylla TaxID=520843 RepID=A0ABD1N9K6_9FABA
MLFCCFLQWIPMVFNVPKTMVLDDVQSLVAAYIYGVNKDTMQHGKEVLIKAGGDIQIFEDRRTLKILVPRGLVDQEVILTTFFTLIYVKVDSMYVSVYLYISNYIV